MAISFQNPPDTPLNFHKFKKNLNLEKSKKIDPKNLKSFWAFLSSILIYASIFYAFNLSPSTLFCTTKFWFFISNTLIIIIAADYISFSSSKNHNYYDEYVEKSSKITSPSFDDKILAKNTKISKEEDKPNEKIINMVEDQTSETLRIREKGLADPDPNPEQGSVEKKAKNIINMVEEEIPNIKLERKYGRSNSDMVVAAAKEGVLQRAFSERRDDIINEEDEFSRMSNEELNSRVEDFIRRFNRQIRLQASSAN